MVQSKYSPGEALNRVKLMMGYDSSKTLNENKSVIFEQNNGDLEYFETVTKSIMKNPKQITNINFGNPDINSKNAITAIKTAVDKNFGTDFKRLKYAIEKGFTKINNSMSIIKNYPSISNESLYDALNGEWFAGSEMDKLVDTVSNQLMEWCRTKQNINICKPKSQEELKYGKI
jgi:hypothetical protein